MNLEKRLGRREFLKYGSAAFLYAACSGFPREVDPEFGQPVNIDFYGLLHFESPDANRRTLENQEPHSKLWGMSLPSH